MHACYCNIRQKRIRAIKGKDDIKSFFVQKWRSTWITHIHADNTRKMEQQQQQSKNNTWNINNNNGSQRQQQNISALYPICRKILFPAMFMHIICVAANQQHRNTHTLHGFLSRFHVAQKNLCKRNQKILKETTKLKGYFDERRTSKWINETRTYMKTLYSCQLFWWILSGKCFLYTHRMLEHLALLYGSQRGQKSRVAFYILQIFLLISISKIPKFKTKSFS